MRAATRFQTSLDRLMAHTDRDVRLQAARCVGRLAGPAVIARLRDLAADPDPVVRREALRTLAAKAPAAGRATLREAFNEETDLECRRAALEGLVAIGDAGIRPALRRLIRNPDAFIYEQSPASQASRQALCCEAVQALAVVGDAGAVPDLLGLLDRHVSPSLDDAVIRTLAELGESGRAAIGRLVREAPAHRARSAVEALAGCADEGQTDALAMFLSHDDEGVRLAAAGSLAKIAPSHSALLRRAHDPSPAVRALVAEHAGPTMPSLLEILLDDPEPEVAAAALGALARLPEGNRSADLLWRVRGKLRTGNGAVGGRAAETLAALDPEAARIDLGERLADPNAPMSVRIAAARVLSHAGGVGAVPALAAQLFDRDEELRRGVMDALATLARRADAGAHILPLFLGVLTHGPEARQRAGLAETQTPWADDAPLKAYAAPPEIIAQVRRDVAGRVGELPGEDVARALAGIVLASEDAELRAVAANALAQVSEALAQPPEPAVEAARRLLDQAETALRLAGLRTLATATSTAGADAIVACLDDADPGLRACAVRWIGTHGEALAANVVDKLEIRLSDRNVGVRLAAMHAIARLRGGRAAGRLIDAAVTAGDESMPAVAACLGGLSEDDVEHELARRLATASGRDRQLALLRLSDAILSAQNHARAA